MKRFLAILLGSIVTLGLGGSITAQQPSVVFPVGQESPTDPELRNLQWNRYTSGNFTILSIDDNQGKWLTANIGKIKTWCVTRWGFPDVEFAHECRIMCVPNRPLMKKLFGLDQSKYEIRRKNGQIDITAMWLVLDDKPARTIPTYLSPICFSEFESNHNVKLPFFSIRGMSLLNATAPEVRQHMAGLAQIIPKNTLFGSHVICKTTEDDYEKLKIDDRKLFDTQAVVLCLMLRKEFGEAKMQGFLRMSNRNNPEDVLRVVYGFRGFTHFDSSYSRFIRDLANDVLKNRTPDSYLSIAAVKK